MACLLGSLTVANAAMKVQDFTQNGSILGIDAVNNCKDFALVFDLDGISADYGTLDLKFVLTPGQEYEGEHAFYADLWYKDGAWLARYYFGVGSGTDNYGEEMSVTDSGTFVMQHTVEGNTGTITFSLLENNELTVLASASGTSYAKYYKDNDINFQDENTYWALRNFPPVTWSNATVWEGIVTAGDLAGSPDTPAVPEPTTATLSLLALAGLAARRRRR